MIIKDNRIVIENTFDKLKNGDMFIYNGNYYIKALHTINNIDNYRNTYGQPASALDLSDGTIVDFDAKDVVIPVNGEVIIE